MSNKTKQTAVEWLISKVNKQSWGDFRIDIPNEIIEQAKEIEIAGKENSYTEGYSEGYKRALELIEWIIKTEIKRTNEQQ